MTISYPLLETSELEVFDYIISRMESSDTKLEPNN